MIGDRVARRWTPGLVLRIGLADGSFGYGRLLGSPEAAFYDYRSREAETPVERIVGQPVAFRLLVHHSILSRWAAVGSAPLEPELQHPGRYFHQDIADASRCT